MLEDSKSAIELQPMHSKTIIKVVFKKIFRGFSREYQEIKRKAPSP